MEDVRKQLWKQVYLDRLEKLGSIGATREAKEAVERYDEMFGEESDTPDNRERVFCIGHEMCEHQTGNLWCRCSKAIGHCSRQYTVPGGLVVKETEEPKKMEIIKEMLSVCTRPTAQVCKHEDAKRRCSLEICYPCKYRARRRHVTAR